MDINGINIKWLGHSGFLIKNSKVIYIDPYNIDDDCEKADLILITHAHYDHCSIADIGKILKDGTKIVMPADCQSKLTRFNVRLKMDIAEEGKDLMFGNVKISAVPAYNIDKSFHPKNEGIGYLIKLNDILIYHAGDTDVIPEMQKLTGHKNKNKEFVALLPIGGRFTMSAEEAAEAAEIIKPSLAIPMHYGSIIGSQEDAEEFVELCKENKINAKILEKE
jgi:L-ascorbate metabolism protein UlaG (beta-lactamase superfamily)